MIVGCYDMHLYCVHERPWRYDERVVKGYHRSGEFPHQFTGPNETECKRAARNRGWKFANNDAICPTCTGFYDTHSEAEV